MRLLRIFTYDVRTSFEETFAPESAAGLFTEDFWRTVGQSYVNFRLDQAPDFVLADPDDPNLSDESRPSCTSSATASSASRTSRSAASGLILFLPLRRQAPAARADLRLGDAAPPAADALPRPADHDRHPDLRPHREPRLHDEAEGWPRARPRRPRRRSRSSCSRTSTAGIGWLLSLRGAVEFTEKAGPADAAGRDQGQDRGEGRPRRGHLLLRRRPVPFAGTPSGAMSVAIEPAQAAAAAPGVRAPGLDRARGSRSATSRSRPRSSKDGFKLEAATKKSAFVIADRRRPTRS